MKNIQQGSERLFLLSKAKNVFFGKKTHFECMRDIQLGSKRLFSLCCCFKQEKTGYQNEIKSETICKGHKIVWKLRGNGIIMVFMIFSFFLRTIKHEYTLFQTRKMIFSTRTLLTQKIRFLHCSEKEEKRSKRERKRFF